MNYLIIFLPLSKLIALLVFLMCHQFSFHKMLPNMTVAMFAKGFSRVVLNRSRYILWGIELLYVVWNVWLFFCLAFEKAICPTGVVVTIEHERPMLDLSYSCYFSFLFVCLSYWSLNSRSHTWLQVLYHLSHPLSPYVH
jgi:hypothetical protein